MMMTELQEQFRGLHSSVVELKSSLVPTTAREPQTPSREEVPQHYEEIPPIGQANGKRGKRAESFKSAVLRVVRERWGANEISGGRPSTDKEIESSYSTLYKMTGKIVKGLPQSLYEGQLQTFKNLPEETKEALINKLTSEANKMGFYIGQCKRNWIAREFLSVQIRNRAQRRLRGPKAPARTNSGNVNDPLSTPPPAPEPEPTPVQKRKHAMAIRAPLAKRARTETQATSGSSRRVPVVVPASVKDENESQ